MKYFKSFYSPKSENALITIPNLVVVFGIIAILFYIFGFLLNNKWLIIISLFIAGGSDLFDGFLARILKQETKIGEIIDPLRNHFLLFAIICHILYVEYDNIKNWCLSFIVFAIEFLIANNNYYLQFHKKMKIHNLCKLRYFAYILIMTILIIKQNAYDFSFFKKNDISIALMLMILSSFFALIVYVKNNKANIYPKINN